MRKTSRLWSSKIQTCSHLCISQRLLKWSRYFKMAEIKMLRPWGFPWDLSISLCVPTWVIFHDNAFFFHLSWPKADLNSALKTTERSLANVTVHFKDGENNPQFLFCETKMHSNFSWSWSAVWAPQIKCFSCEISSQFPTEQQHTESWSICCEHFGCFIKRCFILAQLHNIVP